MKFSLESQIDRIVPVLASLGRQIPFALSLAVNRTAQTVKQEIRQEMERVFDRPTPYTLSSLQMTPATRTHLTATVWVKDGAEKYLLPQVIGGGRRQKRSEQWLGSYWVPGAHLGGGPNVGNLLDRYGNVRPGMITEILAYTGTHPDLYARVSDQSLKRNKRWRRYQYFIEWKDGRPVGVMMRRGERSDVRTVLFFIGQPHYKPRFDFYGVGQRVVKRDGVKNLAEAVKQTIDTTR